MAKLTAARALLSPDEDREMVLRIARSDLSDHLHAYVDKHRQRVIAAVQNWWGKYATTMQSS